MIKKILNKKINSFLGISILVFTLGVSFVAAGPPGSTIYPLIHRGAGVQTIQNLKVGDGTPLPGINASFDISSTVASAKKNQFSGTSNSSFTTLFNGWFADKLFVGVEDENEPVHWVNPTNGITPQSQKVNIVGNLLSTSLANLSGAETVCVDAYGRIKLCGPVNAICGSSDGGSFTSVPTSGLCTLGTSSSVTTNATTYDWTCFGSSGGLNATCQATRTISTNGVCDNSTNNACSAGTLNDIVDNSTNYLWECTGSNGGTTDSCSLSSAQGVYIELSTTTGATCSYDKEGAFMNGVVLEYDPSVFKIGAAGYLVLDINPFGEPAELDILNPSTALMHPDSDTVGIANIYPGTAPSTQQWFGVKVKTLDSYAENENKMLIRLEGDTAIFSGKDVCAAPVNGVCNNSTQNACTAGTPNDGAVADTSIYYRWRCDGINGGSNSPTCEKLKNTLILTCDPILECCYQDLSGDWVPGPPCS